MAFNKKVVFSVKLCATCSIKNNNNSYKHIKTECQNIFLIKKISVIVISNNDLLIYNVKYTSKFIF